MRKEVSTDPSHNQLRDGVKFGFWQHLTHDKKVVSEGSYDESGDKTGLWKSYYEDGSINWEGHYKAHNQVGYWVFYGLQGEKIHEIYFFD